MKFRVFAARFALMAVCALMTAVPAQAKSAYLQCAPYARQISAVKIHGDAWTWWNQAAGRYQRGETPKVGAVMSFKKTARNPFGHVAMVSQIVSDREVLLTHANWSRRGGIEHDVRAIDVSAAGDWSEVRVWFAPIGGLGTSSYPVNGFIYADGAPEEDMLPALQIAKKTDKVLVASLDLDLSDLRVQPLAN
ncbi:surface antigen [Sphingomonas naasensis]|uniref:CHAP domain-containing protein n=1 Tax=Sphingomonas naasensis TaxID=1344951 RepID=A0A4S1WAU0_9SPHN|nr:CHAP domain-containing protein [Sphingomonas naasensis]NIJ19824.1 surface antigen [Sphingomonas naasensis]TGX40044.1 CHAP domain-containing protein [Sphingomonas naasensis]